MSQFYNLHQPSVGCAKDIYGRRDWSRIYGHAAWTDAVDFETIPCPIDPSHQRSGRRIGNLDVVWPSRSVGDFVWTWFSECLLTDRSLQLFRDAGVTGFKINPVSVRRGPSAIAGRDVPRLWELVVTGSGMAHPSSGIRRFNVCEVCGLFRYSSYHHGLPIDEEAWSGTDIFVVDGYPKLLMVTDRVKELIISNQLTNCGLVPVEELDWPDGAIRPEDFYPEANDLSLA